MLQLKHKEKDSVVMLAIFALNTGTGSPKYQITETLKNGTTVVVHKVMCTWNMFFMECMAETRLQAELNTIEEENIELLSIKRDET